MNNTEDSHASFEIEMYVIGYDIQDVPYQSIKLNLITTKNQREIAPDELMKIVQNFLESKEPVKVKISR